MPTSGSNPAGAVMYDLPPALAYAIAHGDLAPLAVTATFPAGDELGIGRPIEDHTILIAALRSHFGRQMASPAVFFYEVHQQQSGATSAHALVIGVVSDFNTSIASDIAAIVPEAYRGTLPVDISFVGANPEIGEALLSLQLAPIVHARLRNARR